MPLSVAAPVIPALPAASEAALLLDLDGTLLDIAARPDEVIVTPDLLPSLQCLRMKLGGALGVITGRPIEQVDGLLGDVPMAVAGEHGGALRHHPHQAIHRPALATMLEHWRDRARLLPGSHPGVLLEEKARGFVLHYRKAPDQGDFLHGWMMRLIEGHDLGFQVMAAHMAWELKPRGADKGTGLLALMAEPPFFGRRPIFIGDDVTDQDAIREAEALGGVGLFVPRQFGSPDAVRAWLRDLAKDGACPGW